MKDWSALYGAKTKRDIDKTVQDRDVREMDATQQMAAVDGEPLTSG